MEISYKIIEQDLLNLAQFQIDQSGYVADMARRRRIIYPIAFGLFALGTWMVYQDTLQPIILMSLAVSSFFISPMVSRWLVQRKLPSLVKSKMGKTSTGERTLTISEDGLSQQTGESYSTVGWSVVDEIVETDTHVFISIDGTYSILIPRRELDPGQLERFLAKVRSKMVADA